ncbi:MAG: transglutaminaseTgpA domain-containing protein, partial [Actinomycetota bacterium]
MSRSPRATDRTLLVAELALASVTIAAVIGLGRLFVDGSFLPPILLAAVASHGVAAGARRLGWGVAASSLVSFGGLVLFVAWVLYPETATIGLPTGATRDAVSTDLSDAWLLFRDVVAPAPVEPGFVLASSASVWAFAFSADWAAFRLLVGLEAVAPSATLFVFASVLGAPRHRVGATALYLAAVLLFLLVHRVLGDHARGTWLTSDPTKGVRALLRAGAGVAAISVLGGMVVGPGLPGADDAALIDWRDRGDDDGSRLTVSPLVDIRGRLVSQSDAEVFTVKAEVRSYWRLTSLERFDGAIWSSQGRYRRAEGVLESFDPAVEEIEGRQDFTIEALASPWLPAAFAPRAIEGGDSVRYEATSASLITEEETSDGMQYAVLSAVPRFTPDELRTADGTVPDDIADEYLDLPPSFDEEVRDLAFSVAGPAPTPYDKALALQQFFRENFSYDINVGSGHGRDAIIQFLARRTGYCEQFAGTYAAMARALGIPARVAVGFTPGEIDGDGVYHVRGEHAHAWPE